MMDEENKQKLYLKEIRKQSKGQGKKKKERRRNNVIEDWDSVSYECKKQDISCMEMRKISKSNLNSWTLETTERKPRQAGVDWVMLDISFKDKIKNKETINKIKILESLDRTIIDRQD